jgi:hypothetical protein
VLTEIKRQELNERANVEELDARRRGGRRVQEARRWCRRQDGEGFGTAPVGGVGEVVAASRCFIGLDAWWAARGVPEGTVPLGFMLHAVGDSNFRPELCGLLRVAAVPYRISSAGLASSRQPSSR